MYLTPSRCCLNLALCLFFLLPSLCFSQTDKVKFQYLTREQGLSSSNVTTIFQDSKQYIWLGTEDGLNRFDGYNITIYKNKPNSPTSISGNFVNSILEDRKNRIWIATNYGLNFYDRYTDAFTRFMHNPKSKGSITSNIILSLFEDKEGKIWVGTDFGLNLYDEKTGTFKSFIQNPNKDRESLEYKVNSICEDIQGNIYLGTDGAGIEIFNPKKMAFVKKPVNSALGILKDCRIVTIKKDPENKMWIGTNGRGLYLLDTRNNTIKHFKNEPNNNKSLSNNVVKSIIFDKQKNVWIGTENGGLNIIPKNSIIFNRYENDQRKPMSFSSQTAACLLEDIQGNVWVGTHHGGVNIYTPKVFNFRNYAKGVWKGALSYNDIRAFIETDKGEIWVGSDGGGINVFNQTNNTFTQKRFSSSDKNTIGSDAILDIMKDSEGTIWVGTWGGGLNRYDEKENKFTRFLHNPKDKSSISSNYPYILLEDKKGISWIGTFYGGLNSFDPKTGKFSRIINSLDGKTKFTGVYVETIEEDHLGNLWFGTLDGGLNCLTADRKNFLHYFNNTQQDLTDAVRAIYTDSRKRLWIGKTGLYLFDHKNKKFVRYTNNPALNNEQIQSIIEDKKGNLWIGTTNGIIQFNPDTKFLKRYTGVDGLQGLEFCQNSAFMSSKGEMFFGGFQGFNTFYPDSINTHTYSYPVHLTDLLVFNKSISEQKGKSTISRYVDQGLPITFSHDQSVISLEYAALNYVSPKKTNYAYRLKGFDKDWNYSGTRRRATYTNLDPGQYTFYVKASSPEGLWNTKATWVNITITPPFYLTWWFKTLVISFTLAGIFAVLYYRRRKEIREIHERNKEQLHQLQLQFFTNISHEFRTPITLIMGTLEQVFKMSDDSILARHYHTINRNANRLMKLISELMDFRKAESGALKLNVMPGNFSSFIREIAEDFKGQAILREFEFNIDQEKEFSNVWYDRQIMEKAILNILNNAFKYTTENGKISIEIRSTLNGFHQAHAQGIDIENSFMASGYLYVIISDTGMGISKNSLKHLFEPYFRVSEQHVGTGIGLAFVKSLISIHKGKLSVYSTIDVGTQITIAIPCNQQDYTERETRLQDNDNIEVQLESIQIRPILENSPINHQPQKKKENTSNLCILIVDDNSELRAFYREILENDYQVMEASDGSEGILKAKEGSPNLIISDVMMPVMDGIEFCQYIKNDFETSHIPFILLTAKDALESRLQGIRSGADYYFSKPVSTDLLLLTIENQFNQQQKIKERYLRDYQVEVRDLVHSAKDKDFMNRLLKIIEEKLEEPELNIDYVSREVGVSKSKLYKKIKDITGQSSNEFIRTIRLKKAMEIMTNEDISVTEVMYRVGISSHSYFTTSFKKEFGITPSKFQQQLVSKAKTN